MIIPTILISFLLMVEPDNRPPIEDLDRFPSQEICQKNIELNQDYQRWLKASMPMDDFRSREYNDALRECEASLEIWYAICNLRNNFDGEDPEEDIRTKLNTLRDLIGNDKYYSCKLPCPVPLHRFQKID